MLQWEPRIMPYPCSYFHFDIKFGNRLYWKEKRKAWPFLFEHNLSPITSILNSTIILDEEPATTEGNNVEDEYEYDEENDYEGEGTEEGTQEGTEEGKGKSPWVPFHRITSQYS